MEGLTGLPLFISNINSIFEVVKSSFSLMLEPPMLFFTCAVGVGVIFKLVKRFIPHM